MYGRLYSQLFLNFEQPKCFMNMVGCHEQLMTAAMSYITGLVHSMCLLVLVTKKMQTKQTADGDDKPTKT